MTAVADLPQVHDCSVSNCAYNADTNCHAGAITIGGDHAHCGTFISIGVRADNNRHGLVGACHRTDCSHNAQLACTADNVSVGAGADVADCLTFAAR